jgi:hypothetical protein
VADRKALITQQSFLSLINDHVLITLKSNNDL